MKKYLLILPLLALMLTGLACGGGGGEETAEDVGTLTLNITDAPIDIDTVDGVYISITRVEIGLQSPGDSDEQVEWIELADYSEEPLLINLLEWTDGEAMEIGDFDIAAGQYNQIRFYLDAPEDDEEAGPPASPGCYISFNDETENAPLFVPSGSNSGYKATGQFEVSANGDTEITVDFDARKSVHVTGGKGQNQRYILKPTLRLIVDNNAGRIIGTVNDQTWGMEDHPWVVYAYEAEDWGEDQYEPADGEDEFADAVTSAAIEPVADTTTGTFTLAYLEQDVTYTLVFAVYMDTGEINEIPMVLEGEDAVLLNQNTVDLETLNTDDYWDTLIIPYYEE